MMMPQGVPLSTVLDQWITCSFFVPISVMQKSYAERMGMSMEDAIIEKQCVAFGKLPAAEQSAKFTERWTEAGRIQYQGKA